MSFSDQDTQPALSAHEETDIEQYSAISLWAIVALLLGLASFFALNSLLLIIIPALAVTAAVVSLTQISRSEGALVGRTVAVIGLSLALLFASSAVARSVSRQWLLRAQAQQFALAWLQLVREGKLHHAHQLHLDYASRQSPDTSLGAFYAASDTAREQFEQFIQRPPLKTIADTQATGEIHVERFLEHVPLSSGDQLAILMVLSDDGSGQPLSLVAVTERTIDDDSGTAHWRMASVVAPREEDR